MLWHDIFLYWYKQNPPKTTWKGNPRFYKIIRNFYLSQSRKSQRKLLSPTLKPLHPLLHPVWISQAAAFFFFFSVVKLAFKYKRRSWAPLLFLARKLESVLSLSLWNSEKNSSVVAGLEFYSLGKECHWSCQTHKLKMFRSFGGREHGVMVEVRNAKSTGQCFIPKTLEHFYSLRSCLPASVSPLTKWNNYEKLTYLGLRS